MAQAKTLVEHFRQFRWGYLFIAALLIVPAVFPVHGQNTNPSPLPIITLEELALRDGKGGHPTWFAYKGSVYDVSTSEKFKEGTHYGNQAGQDLTAALAEAPHAEEVFSPFPVVALLAGSEPALAQNAAAVKSVRRPITIFSKTIAAWSGYILGIFFILNFVTCFAMPWRVKKMPWSGAHPGADPQDPLGHLPFTRFHASYAWLTIIFGIIHGVLALAKSLFGWYI
ncbi:MAG: hypothetical protein HY341_01375 [Candidatus Kerfeldbacteria bacterium]|nr:hypothetical protein [Candidatus Kerfeldbacteria bacterium]